jgi:hypothetical protein
MMFGRNLHWKEWAAPRSVAPARSSNQDASLQQLQDRFRMQTVLRRPRSPLESDRSKQRSTIAFKLAPSGSNEPAPYIGNSRAQWER